MTALAARGQFNGAVLVAQDGRIVYRKAFGKANFQTGADFTPETPSDIGSVTKQFTAMAIMILAERNKLQYDDPVAKYIPEFSRAPHLGRITLRQLLTHTSGMPDYGDLAIEGFRSVPTGAHGRASVERRSVLSKAGQKYRYSNPGYALLAMVVERVSDRMNFGDFLEQEIFQPVGMSSTFVYDRQGGRKARGPRSGTASSARWTTPPRRRSPGTAASILPWTVCSGGTRRSTRRSWFSQSTLAEAFTPGHCGGGPFHVWIRVERSRMTAARKYVWHTGSQAGFQGVYRAAARAEDHGHSADEPGQ